MTRPPIFHDRRKPNDRALRIERSALLQLVGACLVVAVVFVLLWQCTGCTQQQAKTAADREACLAEAKAQFVAAVAARCDTETFSECPEHAAIMSEWDERARVCP